MTTTTKWWDAATIDSTVTKTFVCQHLLPKEIEGLAKPVSFGSGLTSLTYWDWIQSKAKRIFLILVDLGIPDQIFGIIDDSYCDEDLPISLETVENLALTPSPDGRIEKKFYQRQFAYLLKELNKGEHVVYDDSDLVPLDVVDRKPATAGSNMVDKATLPNQPGSVFWRRRVPFGAGHPGCMSQTEFHEMIESSKSAENPHIVSYWASYVHQGCGYILFGPASDFTLKMFLNNQPVTYKNLPKPERKEMVMNWILCLVDTVAFLHSNSRFHSYIKPSTVLFNTKNHVFFANPNRLSPEQLAGQADKNSFDREWYDYAAPEQWFRPTSGPTSPPIRKATLSSSPENWCNISIARTEYPSYSPNAMLHTPNPHLNPQQADIFSVGCIILELLSFLLKKNQKFAAFRAAKHKTPGRGGAVLDSSFHRNLGQVEAWMSDLAREASKKSTEKECGNVYGGIVPMLHVVAHMLSANPHDRPSAQEVQQRTYQILTKTCHIAEPHCVHQYPSMDFDYGLQSLQSLQIDPAAIEGVAINSRPWSRGYLGRTSVSRHGRSNSGGGLSNSGSTSSGSDKDQDYAVAGFSPMRNTRVKPPTSWQAKSLYSGHSGQSTVY
jgi:serine/threonine protein kinase